MKPHAAAAAGVMVALSSLFDGTPAVYVIDHGTVCRSGVSTPQPLLHVAEPEGGVKPPVPVVVIGTVWSVIEVGVLMVKCPLVTSGPLMVKGMGWAKAPADGTDAPLRKKGVDVCEPLGMVTGKRLLVHGVLPVPHWLPSSVKHH